MVGSNKCILFRFTSQTCEDTLRVLTHRHLLKTFPKPVSQSFLHDISDICHLVLVDIHIVSFDESLRKIIKIRNARNALK